MDIAIKRIRREMIEREKEEEKIHDRASFYEWYLQVAYTIAWENRGKILGAHNKRRIAQFDRSGKKIGEYNSIKIAANKCKLNRDVIDDSVSGKTKFTRKAGYYFRYI